MCWRYAAVWPVAPEYWLVSAGCFHSRAKRRGFIAVERLGRAGGTHNVMNLDKEQNGSWLCCERSEISISLCHILESPVAWNSSVYIWFLYACLLSRFPWHGLLISLQISAAFLLPDPAGCVLHPLEESWVEGEGTCQWTLAERNCWTTSAGKYYGLTLFDP